MTARDQELVVKALAPLLHEWTSAIEGRLRALEAQVPRPDAMVKSLPEPPPAKRVVRHRGHYIDGEVYHPGDGLSHDGHLRVATCELAIPPAADPSGRWWQYVEQER